MPLSNCPDVKRLKCLLVKLSKLSTTGTRQVVHPRESSPLAPAGPLSTIGAHWGLTQGAKADKSSFTGERPSVSRTKAFLGLGEMPPDFLEGAGEDLSYMPFLGGACDCRTLVVSFVSKDFKEYLKS